MWRARGIRLLYKKILFECIRSVELRERPHIRWWHRFCMWTIHSSVMFCMKSLLAQLYIRFVENFEWIELKLNSECVSHKINMNVRKKIQHTQHVNMIWILIHHHKRSLTSTTFSPDWRPPPPPPLAFSY